MTNETTRRIAKSFAEKLVGGVAEYVKQTKDDGSSRNDV